MRVSDFNYELPEELIAQYPLPDRSASKLLCLGKGTGRIAHRKFTDLLDILNPDDLLILNNTKVIPARLYGQKESGGKIEILVERIIDDHTVMVQVKASKAPKPGTRLVVAASIQILVESRSDDLFKLKFLDSAPILEVLHKYGHIPLPPYIERNDEKMDQERYQTVFAEKTGAVAAPTAGLHFDAKLLQQLQRKGVKIVYITLHVGAGTFQPIRVEEISAHKMHAEWIEVTSEVCAEISATKKRGGRVVAVGTTCVRSLETAAQTGELQPYRGETSIFIYPGFEFQCVDAIITNFHLPKSTLLMLVCAFAGYDHVMHAYREAIANQYRFFSYGDAMLLL